MSTTAPAPHKNGRAHLGETRAEPSDARPTPRLAPPPKLRRRPVLVAASVAAICLGALGSVWVYTSTTDTRDVLAVRHTIDRGQLITAEDLMSVRISVDPALHPLPASQGSAVVGKHAALDMPAGGVVTAEQVTDTPIPAAGDSVVGISLPAATMPAGQVRVGDQIRVVTTPGQQGEVGNDDPAAVTAVVVGLSTDPATANTVVNVQVPFAAAPKVAALAATGKVAIVLDSRER